MEPETVQVVLATGLDPRGGWTDWGEPPPGVRFLRVPTVAALTLLGARAYQDLLVDLAAREGAALLVTRPPLDFLDEATAARLRAGGTRTLGYALDERLVEGVAVARLYDRWVTPREVPWATAPAAALAPLGTSHEVALVGRRNPRRVALVERLRAAGVNVIARGPGWEQESVERGATLDLYARSSMVLTTVDADDHSVTPAVARLLETAMLGVYQLAQDAPELAGYFPDDEVPRWSEPEGLVQLVEAALADAPARRRAAAAARARALDEHSVARRWPALVAGLELEARAPSGRSLAYQQLLLALASCAEAAGQMPVAVTLFAEVHARDPDEPAAAAGLGRCLRDLGQLEAALPPLRRAAAAPAPPFAAAHAGAVALEGVGTGLGRLALLPPAAEPLCALIGALVELGRIDEALATIDGIEGAALLDAVSGALGGDLPAVLKERLGDRLAAARGDRP
jgi:tetratricopeptide (TPR) repeat protein